MRNMDSFTTLVSSVSPAQAMSAHPQIGIAPFDSTTLQKAFSILEIISRYRLNPFKDTNDNKQPPPVLPMNFLAQTYAKVVASEPIRLCLPAFPFKSPNTRSKVLGNLPDKAEEFALAHLNGMCNAIRDIYAPGAKLMIISDGLVYNDLLGVPDRDVWNYGEALRALTIAKGFDTNIEFSRLRDLCHVQVGDTRATSEEKMDEITYVANATNFRLALLNRFGRSDFDVAAKLAEDEDTCLTYRGYIKFLMTDLQDVYPLGPGRTKSKFKRSIEQVAKQMLYRGDAFSRAVRETFPSQIRLSIHPSTASGDTKISISPLPTDSTVFTTPWHSTIAFRLDGTITSGHHATFSAPESNMELVLDEDTGRPSYYREKSPNYSFAEDKGGVVCEPLYPSGLMIRPSSVSKTDTLSPPLSINDIDSAKVRALAEVNSPVILRGFTQTGDRELFVAKGHELGVPTPWKFGLVLEVKDRGTETRGLNNVLSAEWMPFHYDGLFKTEKRMLDDGREGLVSLAPHFQLFTAVTPSPRDTGFTIFSSSTLLFKHLPASPASETSENPLSLSSLRQKTWTVSTDGFENTVLPHLPLIVNHPTTGVPCLRYHEPWPQEKTKFQATRVTIDDDIHSKPNTTTTSSSSNIASNSETTTTTNATNTESNHDNTPPESPTEEEAKEAKMTTAPTTQIPPIHPASNLINTTLSSLLHDRRVAYYHAWEKGDMIINDNILTMHTRSDFRGGSERELWRIHFD